MKLLEQRRRYDELRNLLNQRMQRAEEALDLANASLAPLRQSYSELAARLAPAGVASELRDAEEALLAARERVRRARLAASPPDVVMVRSEYAKLTITLGHEKRRRDAANDRVKQLKAARSLMSPLSVELAAGREVNDEELFRVEGEINE